MSECGVCVCACVCVCVRECVSVCECECRGDCNPPAAIATAFAEEETVVASAVAVPAQSSSMPPVVDAVSIPCDVANQSDETQQAVEDEGSATYSRLNVGPSIASL